MPAATMARPLRPKSSLKASADLPEKAVEAMTVCTVQSTSPPAAAATPSAAKSSPTRPEGYETIAAALGKNHSADDVWVQSSSSSDDPPVLSTTIIPPHLLDRYGFIKHMDAQGNLNHSAVDDDAVLPTFAETKRQERRLIKWNLMLTTPTLDRFRRRRPKLVCKRLRKGVPHSIRGTVWGSMAGVPEKIAARPGLYEQLVRDAAFGVSKTAAGKTVSHGRDLLKIQDTIERDIHRTFPRHGMFYQADGSDDEELPPQQQSALDPFCSSAGEISSILRDLEFSSATSPPVQAHPDARSPESVVEGKGGQASLRRVLKAYSMYDKEIGYCQGMNFISAMFLTVMPEEEAFWLLVATMYDPPCKMRSLFAEGMQGTHKVLYVAEKLIHQFLPKLAKHMDRENIHVTMYATQWLLTQYSSSFRFDLVMRVWDAFLGEGWKPTYRVMLSLLQHFQSSLLRMSFEEILAFMRELPERVDGAAIFDNSLKIPLRRKHIIKYEKQWLAQQQ